MSQVIRSIQSPRIIQWAGPTAVAITGLIMLCLSWGTWPDCTIDFGREIYTPWQLSEGKVLYRDIVSYFNGPLSPYVHSLIFRIFGTSLQTLVWFNLCLITLLAILLYYLLNRAFGALAATAGGICFFVLFAFAQLSPIGNYNFVCPYSYELPHGITLSAAALACMARWHASRHRRWHARVWLAAASLLLGMVFLTKAEVFLAAAAALLMGLVAGWWLRRENFVAIVADVLIVVTGTITPVSAALLLLMIHLSASEALHALAGSWPWMTDRTLLEMPYFKRLLGTDDLRRSLLAIVRYCILYGMALGIPAAVGILLPVKPGRRRLLLTAGVFVFALVFGFRFESQLITPGFVRPAPLFLGAALVFYLASIVRRRSRGILELMLVVWALVLLAKIALNATIMHYGFALAMPATLVVVGLLLDRMPRAIDRSGGFGGLLRATTLAGVIVACHANFVISRDYWAEKTTVVSARIDGETRDPDRFRSGARGVATNQIMRELGRVSSPGATLVTIPEGLILNYLTRHENPTGQLNFTPPAVAMYTENRMLEAFRNRPPDFIIYLHMSTIEYGVSYFGVDYAQQLGAWIRKNYEVIHTIPADPDESGGLAIMLLRRK